MKISRTKNFILFIVALIIVIVALFPIYWMIKTAISQEYVIYKNPPSLFTNFNDLDLARFVRLARESHLLRWILNTLFVAIITSCLTIVVSLPAAYALSRYRMPFNKTIGYMLLVTRMMPLTLLIVPMYVIVARIKLIDSYMAVILTDLAYILPFTIWTLKSFINSIPNAIDDAARIDGCSVFKILYKMILPLSLPGIGSALVYSFVRVWGEYLFANSFLKSPEKYTVTVGAQLYAGSIHVSWGNIMAVTTIGSIPMIFIFLYLEKYYVGGLSAGAVKA